MLKLVTTIKPIHPGEVLSRDFMEPVGVSANRLANHIGVSINRIETVINGQSSITSDTAIRLSRAFDTTPNFWVNLQSHFDIECAKDKAEINFGSIVQDID